MIKMISFINVYFSTIFLKSHYKWVKNEMEQSDFLKK